MENASKALVIAGGVLIALMIIATLMYMVQNTASFSKSEEDQKRLEQITKFNLEYESFSKSIMRGTDVVTVANMAHNNNQLNINYPSNEKPVVIIKVTLLGKLVDKLGIDIKADKNFNSFTVGNIDSRGNSLDKTYDSICSNENSLKAFKRLIFRCTELKYNNKTGYVSELHFEEIETNDLDYVTKNEKLKT